MQSKTSEMKDRLMFVYVDSYISVMAVISLQNQHNIYSLFPFYRYEQ